MLKSEVKKLPKNPGIYIFKNKFDEIIYIGKAKNLRKRVSSYFILKHENSFKTQFLVRNISDIDYIIVDSEMEALLLENKLIKKHKPKYNINLKDSKTYPYIKISNEKIPRISITRIVKKDGDYFGPFSDAGFAKELFLSCIKLFKILSLKSFSSKSSLNYEIGLSPAKSLDEIDVSSYMKNVLMAKEFLKGKNISKLLLKLEKEMREFSSREKFEAALERKKQIETILRIDEMRQKVDLIKSFDQDIIFYYYGGGENKGVLVLLNISRGVISSKKEFRLDYDENVYSEFIKMYYSKNSCPKEIIVGDKFWEDEIEKEVIEKYLSGIRGSKVKIVFPQKGEKLSLVKLAEKNAKDSFSKKSLSLEVKEKLGISSLPLKIDCFDMSNLGFDYLVGASVRWENEVEVKDCHRKFEIKSFFGKNDDFASMKEVVYRRYKMILDGRDKCSLPDLIIIDGGKGQLNVAKKSLIELGLSISLISIAKGDKRDRNEVYVLGRDLPFVFDDNSSMMLYLRRIRDSAHNFVISYNRKKRQMRFRDEIFKG